MLLNETNAACYLVRAGDPATSGFLLPQNVPITLNVDNNFDITDAYNAMHTASACTIDVIETLGPKTGGA